MKLVSMKAKDEGGHGHGCCCDGPTSCESPDYPWGLRITLDEAQLAALGMEALPAVGGPIGLEAAAVVMSASEEQVDGKTRRTLQLQITDLAVAAAGTSKLARMYEGDPTMKG